MVDTVTTPSGTSVSYSPWSGMGGYGNNGGGFGGNNGTQAAEFLSFLFLLQSQQEGFHHILAREAQIQTDIASAEGAVQSAISASQNSISSQLGQGVLGIQSQASTYALNEQNLQAQYALATQNTASQNALANANQLAQVQLQAAGLQANTSALVNQSRYETNQQVRNVNDSVAAGTLAAANNFGALATQTAAQTGAITGFISADGQATRAAVQALSDKVSSINEANLNRMLSTAQNEIIELRGDRAGILRSHGTEVTVSQNVAQAQAQQQQQATLGGILARLEGLTQVAHATNQNVIAGNQGAVQTGAQTSNPTNIRT